MRGGGLSEPDLLDAMLRLEYSDENVRTLLAALALLLAHLVAQWFVLLHLPRHHLDTISQSSGSQFRDR